MNADRISSRTKFPALSDCLVKPEKNWMTAVYQSEEPQDSVYMPSLVRREPLRSERDLGGHAEFELVVGNFQEGQQLSHEHPNVYFVDKGIRELERTPPDGNITVTQTIEDNITVPLHRVRVHRDNFVEGV
jgi:hypothetical protein